MLLQIFRFRDKKEYAGEEEEAVEEEEGEKEEMKNKELSIPWEQGSDV